jgi:hypothetical protein
MDVVMAGGADHEGLSSLSCHELGPWRLWLPGFAEVGELADVVDFHLASALAHLTSSGLEPLDELRAADDARGWLTVCEDRVALPFEGDATESGGQRFPAGAFDGCLQARAWPVRGGDGGLVAGRHLRY